MARLTRAQAREHAEAETLLERDQELTDDDVDFVLEHWQESAQHVNGDSGAFFTPPGLARDLTLEVGPVASLLDQGAGIGTLSIAVWQHHRARRLWDHTTPTPRIVCVENNADYVRIGRQLLPEATWLHRSLFDLPTELGPFDVALSNPPYGRLTRDGDGAGYSGPEFEFHVVAAASALAHRGVFILPQMSLGWRYSGAPYFHEHTSDKHNRFHQQTGITLEPGCGIDTSLYAEHWHGTSPRVEIALADFRACAQ